MKRSLFEEIHPGGSQLSASPFISFVARSSLCSKCFRAV